MGKEAEKRTLGKYQEKVKHIHEKLQKERQEIRKDKYQFEGNKETKQHIQAGYRAYNNYKDLMKNWKTDG